MSARQAPDVVSQIKRMQEEIRQLRLRLSGGSAPGQWQSLGYYLAPHWKGLANITGIRFGTDADYNDLTHEHGPRFYVDRDRVYLGGNIEWDSTRVGESNVYGPPGDESSSYATDRFQVTQWFPADWSPARQTFFRVDENLNFTESGWLGSQAWSRTPTPGGRSQMELLDVTFPTGGPGYTGDPLEDGTVVCLDGISWRIG